MNEIIQLKKKYAPRVITSYSIHYTKLYESLSAFYNSEPWGFESVNSFLNAVLCVETDLLPLDLLHQTKQIEVCMGRTAKSSDGIYSDRIMDIDLLLYDALIMETPQLVRNNFV